MDVVEATIGVVKTEESLDSWSDTSGDYSVVSDGGASASAESIAEEVPKEKQDLRRITSQRRWTSCPEKKLSSTYLESYPKRTASGLRKPFRRSRCLRNKLETIFEYPVLTTDNKVVFLRLPKRRVKGHSVSGITSGYFRRSLSNTVKKSVEEVDQLMMNLDIDNESRPMV